MKRFGSANWNAGLREGKGSVSTESRVMANSVAEFIVKPGAAIAAKAPMIKACPKKEGAFCAARTEE
jgi:hypothetical protein